ncbi:hypothetical protein Droror1_Dr00023107 [Drosera rotundifolia]
MRASVLKRLKKPSNADVDGVIELINYCSQSVNSNQSALVSQHHPSPFLSHFPQVLTIPEKLPLSEKISTSLQPQQQSNLILPTHFSLVFDQTPFGHNSSRPGKRGKRSNQKNEISHLITMLAKTKKFS